jgi:hypothetical protein
MQSRIIMSNKIHGIISKYVICLDNNYINAMLWMNKINDNMSLFLLCKRIA